MNTLPQSAPQVRPFSAAEWRVYRDLRLRALADAPDSFGSTLAREQGRTDEDWRSRLTNGVQSGGDWPLLAEVAGQPAGLAWVRLEPAETALANLYQMWVDPAYRGLGAGRQLLAAACDWARAQRAAAMLLGVTRGNTAAERLYAQAGFAPVGEPEPLRPGSDLQVQLMRLELGPRP